MYKVVSSLSRASVDCCPLYFSRVTMASGRNHYIKRGSNKQDISPETKKMIRDARDPDDHSWQLGHGIREPLEMDLTTNIARPGTRLDLISGCRRNMFL